MLKNIKNILVIALGAITCFSCTDYLTTAPKGSLSPDGFYSSKAHAEEGLLGVYSILRSVETNQYSLFSEYRSDNMWCDPAPNGIRVQSEVAFMRYDETTSEVASLWNTWYQLINNCNSVLENAMSVDFGSDSYKNQFQGELYFLRGYAHFELARTYGNVPIVDHCLSIAEASALKQSTPAEVIAFAIKDLQKAEELLPYEDAMVDASGNKIGGEGRADKIVAEAMLGRAYMTLYGWPYKDNSAKASAKTYLKKVLDYSVNNSNKYWAPTITDWKKMWLVDYELNNKYTIFAIQHRLNSGNGIVGSESVGLTLEYVPKGTTGSSMTPGYIEAQMQSEYHNTKDLRGEGWTYLDGYKAYGSTLTDYSNREITLPDLEGKTVTAYEWSIITKFQPTVQKFNEVGVTFDWDGHSGGWATNFPVIRLEDIQLMYAELLVEDGSISEAMGYVNAIRKRAGVEVVPTNASAADALKYIKRERKLELYMEGVRWFDEIRYGEWDTLMKAQFDNHKLNGEYQQGVSTSNIVAGRYLNPIPYAQLQAVPGLYNQNEGWK